MGRYGFVAALVAGAVGCTQAPPPSIPSPSPTAPAPAPARSIPNGRVASATLHDLAGARVGTVTFTDSYSGLLVAGEVSGLGLGGHAIHLHAVGKCEPPFTTAGAHFNPLDKHHGYRNADGPHLGDMPNIDTPAAGRLRFEFLVPGVTLKGENALLDADGASIVVHSSRDDYVSDPAGNSGSRIACGVITAR
jgi:Cu-Zn family superoxide dismutase